MNSLLTEPDKHPANSPLTGERIERVIEALESSLKYRNGSSMDHFIADAVKGLRELRVSRETAAQPVAYRKFNSLLDWYEYFDYQGMSGSREPLYAAPPAPVVDWVPLGDSPYDVPYSMPSNLRELIAEEIGILFSVDDAQSVWNVCRSAAMLQSFGNSEQLEPVSNRDELPPNSFTDDELEAMAHGNNPQANAYRELLARRNSPVTPDGWIPVSERMPETDGNYWGWWSESKRQGPVWFIKSDLQAQFQSSEITHWMPLPAAPKEVG